MTCRDITINESTMYEALTEACVLLAQEATELDYCKDCGVEEILLSAFGNLQRGNHKLRSVSKITVWDFSAKITVWEPDNFHDSPKRSSYLLLLLCLTLIKFKQTSVSGQGGVVPFFTIILSYKENILNIVHQETIESLWKVERRQTVCGTTKAYSTTRAMVMISTGFLVTSYTSHTGYCRSPKIKQKPSFFPLAKGPRKELPNRTHSPTLCWGGSRWWCSDSPTHPPFLPRESRQCFSFPCWVMQHKQGCEFPSLLNKKQKVVWLSYHRSVNGAEPGADFSSLT